jgi:hypothetical protein
MNKYKLELIDNEWCARIYVDGIKTSAYIRPALPNNLPKDILELLTNKQTIEDDKPF